MTNQTPIEPLVQPIAENLWWVIPSQLAGVRKPMAEELTELQASGIGAFSGGLLVGLIPPSVLKFTLGIILNICAFRVFHKNH